MSNPHIHPRCIVFTRLVSTVRTKDGVFLLVIYDPRDKVTEQNMRAGAAMFDVVPPGISSMYAPLEGERLAVFKLDETHGG